MVCGGALSLAGGKRTVSPVESPSSGSPWSTGGGGGLEVARGEVRV